MELCICYNRKLKSDHLFFSDPPNTLEKDEALVEQKYLLTIGKKEGTQSATGSFIIWLFAGTLLYFVVYPAFYRQLQKTKDRGSISH